ncbi:MAG: S1 RNA-binding domain-containing protein [Persicimonas sp.]
MSDETNEKKNDEKKSSVRKRVKVVEEVVEDTPPEEEADETTAEGKSDYTTEHKAGSKVRVARAKMPTGSTTSGGESREEASKEEAASDKDAADAKTSADKPPAKAPQPPSRRAVDIRKQKEEERKAKEMAKAKKASQDNKRAKKGRGQRGQKPPKLEYAAKPEPDVSTADFEALLAGTEGASAPQVADVEAGDRIKGCVAAIGEKFIFVEFGSSKSEGYASRDDFLNEEGELEVEMGDEHEFYVLGTRGNEIQLGKNLSGREGAMEAIRTAHATGVPIEGRVDATNKGGFEVMIGGVRAFCPVSQIELGYTEEPDGHVGQTYRFRVEQVAEGGKNVVVSRSALLEEERKAQREDTLDSLEEGQVVKGLVTRVVDFGAFIDIGGVEGLAHVSELAHGFFDKPTDVVSPGDEVEVKILNIDRKDGDLRIGLSIKETQGDPWEDVNKKFSVGDQVEGEVVRLAPFGAFVEVSPGIDGLVHVSEMSWKEHVKHPQDVLSPGETIMVEIQDIDQVRQRMSLSMKAVEGDPWDSAAERYAQAMEVTGTVENIEDFGVFVRLDSGITALIPRSEMDLPSGVTPHRKYTEGEQATARVLDVNPGERKMALTEKSAEDIQTSGDTGASKKSKKPKKSSGGGQTYTDTDSGGGFGTLGDLLGDKLDED